MPSIHIDKHIVLDQIQTWPQNILDLIQRNEIHLKEFLSYENKKRQEKDFKKRIKFSPNKNKELWDSTLNEISEELISQKIVGIHCTNLMDYEITEVQEVGLFPLNKEHAIKRVEKLYNKGFISKKLKDEISNKSDLEDDNRVGTVFVFHDTTTLKDEYGLNKLFCFWGGEAIFQYLNNPKQLYLLGIPCIVLTSISSIDLDLSNFAETMLCIYFNDGYKRLTMESPIEKKLKVIDVIQHDSNLFKKLTSFDSWNVRYETLIS